MSSIYLTKVKLFNRQNHVSVFTLDNAKLEFLVWKTLTIILFLKRYKMYSTNSLPLIQTIQELFAEITKKFYFCTLFGEVAQVVRAQDS